MVGFFDDPIAYLQHLFDPTAALSMPPVVPTGTSPTVVPSSGSRPPLTLSGPMLGGTPPAASGGLLGGQGLLGTGQQGLLGNSIWGKLLGGAMSGLGSVQPGQTGLAALGAGAKGATEAADVRQQQQLKNWYMQNQMAAETQKTTDAATKKQYLETLIAGLPKAQQDAARADPDTFLAQYTKAQFAGAEPPKSRTINQGGQEINQEWDQKRGTWTTVGTGPRWAPPSHTTVNIPKPPATMDERDRNILLHGDPSTAEYAAAYANFMKPQIHQNPDGTWTQITPQAPTWAQPPTYALPGAAGGGGASATGDGTMPPPVTSSEVSGGPPASTTAPSPAAGGTTATSPKGPTVTTGGTPKPAPLTQDQAKTRQLYNHSVQQMPDIIKNYDELSKWQNVASSKIGGTLGPATMSGPALLAYNGLLDFAASYLYVTSGATANPGEVQNLLTTIMPTFNDPPEDIAAKKARMQNMLVEMGGRAGLPVAGGQGRDTKWIYKDGKLVPEGTP